MPMPSARAKARGTLGPFATAAPTLRDLGLLVMPLAGKTPTVRGWRQWKGLSQQAIKTLSQQFPSANIGIITGELSRVTIIDVDDLSLLPMALNRFGRTPLQIRSGSRTSVHLYYRFAGEGCPNIRQREGLRIDVKGEGGFVVSPPSLHPDTGAAYDFEVGSWADLPKIPTLDPSSLPCSEGRHKALGNVARLGVVAVGVRNNTLFRTLLRQAPYCDDIEALRDVAFTVNEHDFDEPLPSVEVEKTLRSAWQYEIAGHNWVGRTGGMIQISGHELDILAPFPDAFVFFAFLRCRHGRSELPFAISPKAMADAQSVPRWTDHRRYRRARDRLVELDFLERVHEGGSRRGDPHLFRFRRGHLMPPI